MAKTIAKKKNGRAKKSGITIREADAYYKMWCFAPSYREKMRDALRTAGLPQ